jgi:hypothetical protein
VAAAITDTLTPQVSPKPGGPLNRMKQTLKGGKSSSRRTRRRRSRR